MSGITDHHVIVYTDGSCHTQLRIGGWAALIFIEGNKHILTGTAQDTTHNRMELTAVIDAIKYISLNISNVLGVHIYSDSQYVVGLTERKQKLSNDDFITKKGNKLQNADLMKELWLLEDSLDVTFEKIKAHQKQTEAINHNIEADKLSRQIVRGAVALHMQAV